MLSQVCGCVRVLVDEVDSAHACMNYMNFTAREVERLLLFQINKFHVDVLVVVGGGGGGGGGGWWW